MMKVSYKNGVPAVSLRQDDGYTGVPVVYPLVYPKAGV